MKTSSVSDIFGLFFPLYLPAFLFSVSQSLLIPVLPLYAQSFHASYGLVGVVLAGESIGMLAGDLPAGVIIHRLGQKRSMTLGLVLTGISNALIFWAPGLWMIIACRMVAGLGTSLFSVSRHYYLAEMTPPGSRGRIISLFGGVFRMGRMAGPLIGGSIAAAFGLRYSFLAFGVICLAALIVVVIYLPVVEVDESQVDGQAGVGRISVREVLRAERAKLLAAGPGFLLLQMIRTGPSTILPIYGANVLGLSVDRIGLVVSVGSALDMLLFYPAGILMDRKGRKHAIISSCLLLGLGIATIPFTDRFATLLMAALLAGFGNGLGSGAMLTLGSDLAPARGRSEFLGAWTLIGDFGSTTGPLAVGWLAECMPLSFTIWVIAAGGLASAAIFAARVPETLKRREA